MTQPNTSPSLARRVLGVAGNQSLRVVVTLHPCDDHERPCAMTMRPMDMIEQLRPLLREADLPLCLHHDLPAIRFERNGDTTAIRIEVLVLDGSSLEEKIARLRELVRPLRVFLPL